MRRNAEILIAEDSPTQAEELRHLLEGNGYEIRLAGDGHEALAAAREHAPGLVITDIVMPAMDGYELCRAIKSDRELREVPVILLTSLSQPQDVIKSLECGADNFIRKPYEERYLLSRVSNILTSRELRLNEKVQVGVEVYLAGETHFITAERQQILDFLLSTYEEVAQMNEELTGKNAELQERQTQLQDALHDLDAERSRAQNLADVNRAVLDATADGIALIDETGNTLLWNAAYARIMSRIPGLARDAPVTGNLEAVAPHVADPAALRSFIESLGDVPEEGASCDVELPDAALSLRLFAAPVRDTSSDAELGRILVVRDVTAERAADRLKSELVATVSHELRTPLAAILGFAEMLATREMDSVSRRRVETIIREAERLASLVNDFLDLHRIEQGSFALELEPVDLTAVVREAVETFSAQSSAHSIRLDLPSSPVRVLGERDRLVQVLGNLLSNAIKYSPEGGVVHVRVRDVDGKVEVTVQDQGVGIPAEAQDRIFTRFFRVRTPETDGIGGTGLGLALSREIVEAHGGEIGFESVEGAGSKFWVRLPGSTPEPQERGAVTLA
jgi:signal transduction histidine kinase